MPWIRARAPSSWRCWLSWLHLPVKPTSECVCVCVSACEWASERVSVSDRTTKTKTKQSLLCCCFLLLFLQCRVWRWLLVSQSNQCPEKLHTMALPHGVGVAGLRTAWQIVVNWQNLFLAKATDTSTRSQQLPNQQTTRNSTATHHLFPLLLFPSCSPPFSHTHKQHNQQP